MSEDVKIDIRTAADTQGAKDAEKALDDVKQSAEESGKSATGAGDAGGASMTDFAGKVLKTVVAYKTLKAVVRGLINVLNEAAGQEVLDASQAALIRATGGAAGYTRGELKAMTSQLSELTRVADESISKAQNLLLTFTNIQGQDVFERAIRSSMDMATVMGGDAASAASQLGRALNDPAQGLTMLSRAGVQFTAEQRRMIQAMAEGGDLAGAQAMILDELERRMGGVAEAAGKTLAGSLNEVKNAWGDSKQAMGSFIGELPAVRFLIDGLGSALRTISDGIESWRNPLRDVLMSMQIQFQALDGNAEDLLDTLERIRTRGFGNLPRDAEALKEHLQEMADNADRAIAAMDELARARLDLAMAEIDQREAAGEISKNEADRQRIQLRAAAQKEALDRELVAKQERIAILEKQAAEAEKAHQQKISEYNQMAARAAEYTDEEAKGVRDRKEAGLLSDDNFRLYFERREKAMSEANQARGALEKSGENVVDLRQMLEASRAELETARELADILRKTVELTSQAGLQRIDAREQKERLQAEQARLRDKLREIERAQKEAPATFQPGVDREREEAAAAEAAVAEAERRGSVGGYSIQGGEGARRMSELRAAAERERAAAAEAAQSMENSLAQLTQTFLALSERLKEVEGQIRNMP